MAKRQEEITNREICQGVSLSATFYEQKENRLLTLILKGFVVYLLTMGSIGFYLSALDIKYNALLCHIVIFAMAIFSAMLYYRLLVENLGYLVVFGIFAVMVYFFRTFINSGFYAVVNITVDGAAQYFNVDIQRIYNEQITNRYVTVTFAVLFIGIVLDIFLNVYISRRMQYVTAIFVVLGLNMIPLYLIYEPDNFYAIMLMGGIAMAYVFRSGKHYSPQVSVKRDNRKFKEKGKKKEIAYVYDVKAMSMAGLLVFCIVATIMSVVTVFKPKDSFNVGYGGNKYKELSMAAVSTILMDGWQGFFRMSRDVGGLQSGQLGEVSTIRLDYQTDLVVHMTPYTDDRIYLKSFEGGIYNPYENNWTSIYEVREYVEHKEKYNLEILPEGQSLKDAFEDGYEKSAKAVMKIRNVGSSRFYVPYYYDSHVEEKGFDIITYYPRLEENNVYVDHGYYYGLPYTEADLYVPEENIKAVETIVGELGMPITEEQIIQALIDYYQENIPYTIQPGKTPSKEDFVNNFLLEKKKGYCSHYASAAVLIFRYMGIPARYVEGYAIDYEQLYSAELVQGQMYEDYYEGYSEIGKTALVSVNVTDADAHAWVEVYRDKLGWYPVEVTPASTTEEESEDFWSMFSDFMDEQEANGNGAGDAIAGGPQFSDKIIKGFVYTLLYILGGIIIVFLGIRGYKQIIFYVRYFKSDTNDRLILNYQKYCGRLRRKNKEFGDMLNYKQQISYIASNSKKASEISLEAIAVNDIIEILERAGFSKERISDREYRVTMDWLKKYI